MIYMAGLPVPVLIREILASTDFEATDPKFDDVKILARSQQGNLITIPIKVSYTNEYTYYI